MTERECEAMCADVPFPTELGYARRRERRFNPILSLPGFEAPLALARAAVLGSVPGSGSP
ncbi:hypothetical protein [Methanopyrus kandleri]